MTVINYKFEIEPFTRKYPPCMDNRSVWQDIIYESNDFINNLHNRF